MKGSWIRGSTVQPNVSLNGKLAITRFSCHAKLIFLRTETTRFVWPNLRLQYLATTDVNNQINVASANKPKPEKID